MIDTVLYILTRTSIDNRHYSNVPALVVYGNSTFLFDSIHSMHCLFSNKWKISVYNLKCLSAFFVSVQAFYFITLKSGALYMFNDFARMNVFNQKPWASMRDLLFTTLWVTCSTNNSTIDGATKTPTICHSAL